MQADHYYLWCSFQRKTADLGQLVMLRFDPITETYFFYYRDVLLS
jgi:hypothetical protein